MNKSSCKTGVRLNVKKLKELQKKYSLKFDKTLAERLKISRSTLWRIKLPTNDPRHHDPGDKFIANALSAFPDTTFEELFFLDGCCDKVTEKIQNE